MASGFELELVEVSLLAFAFAGVAEPAGAEAAASVAPMDWASAREKSKRPFPGCVFELFPVELAVPDAAEEDPSGEPAADESAPEADREGDPDRDLRVCDPDVASAAASKSSCGVVLDDAPDVAAEPEAAPAMLGSVADGDGAGADERRDSIATRV